MKHAACLFFFMLLWNDKLFPQLSTCAGPISDTVTPLPDLGRYYSQGQTVVFTVVVNGYNQDISNWFHGLTLNFGPGWDTGSLSVISYPTPANPGNTSPDSPNVWGYFPAGVTGAVSGTYFGPGFYFETGESDGANGGVYDGNPGDNYGDDCTSGNCIWQFKFSIRVSPIALPGTSLSLSVLPSGDGESGDWSGGLNDCNDPPVTICTALVGDSSIFFASTNSNNVSCYGLCDGSASVTIYNGHPPYRYIWNTQPVQTDSAISDLCPGTYTCIILDSLNDTAAAAIIISEPNPLSLSDSIIQSCGDSCHAIVITQVGGGTGPYNYTWNGGTAPNAPGDSLVCAGTLMLSVSDANSCVLLDSFNIVQIATAISLDSDTVIAATCAGLGDGAIFVAAGGGAGSFTYTWSDSANSVQYGGPLITNLNAGAYYLRVNDTAGCVFTGTFWVTQPMPLTVNHFSITAPLCTAGCTGGVTVEIGGGTFPYNYSWTSGTALNQAMDDSLCAGTVGLTVTDSNNCALQDSFNLLPPGIISLVGQSVSQVTCPGGADGSILLDATGGPGMVSYFWTNLEDSTQYNGPNLYNLRAGTYAVTISDSSNCYLQDTFVITQPPAFSLLFSSTEPTCDSMNGVLRVNSITGGTAPYTLLWSNGYTTEQISHLAAGTYYVTITDANSCSYVESASLSCITGIAPVISSVYISIYPNPAGDKLQLEIGNGAAGPVQAEIQNAAGQMVLCQTIGMSTKTELDISNLAAGVYFIQLHNGQQSWVRKFVKE